MVAISDSTIRSNVFETLYDELTAANLLSSTATVTAAYISSDDAPFPQVVVSPVDVDKTPLSFDRSHFRNDIVVDIDIWTRKNKDKDLLADEIDALISPLKIPGVCLSGWTESNALEPQGGNKVHLKTIRISYIR